MTYRHKIKTVPMHAVKKYGGVKVWLNSFLTPTQDGGVCSASRRGLITPVEIVPTYCSIGGFEGPRTSLDTVGGQNKPLARPEIEPRLPVRQVRSLATIPTVLPQLQGL